MTIITVMTKAHGQTETLEKLGLFSFKRGSTKFMEELKITIGFDTVDEGELFEGLMFSNQSNRV